MKDAISGAAPASSKQSTASSSTKRKIPIGVFDPVYDKFSLDEMLEKVSALGLEAMEIGTGGYPGTHHCPVDELLADPAKAKAWQKKFEDRGIHVDVLTPGEFGIEAASQFEQSCHTTADFNVAF